MLLLGIKHSRQRREADCLVACCAMVLDYLQVPIGYNQLTRLLETQDFGSFFSRVHNLETLGLTVETGKEAPFAIFEQFIEPGLPIIVPVRTWTLLHWQEFDTEHAVVVVGIDVDNETIYIHDSFFGQAPLALSFDEFDPAWTEMDRRYAVIGLTEMNK